MRFARTTTLALAVTAAFIAFSSSSEQASAQNVFLKTYKVQVEYWFFDTDFSFWYTEFESSNLNEALLVYDLLQIAKESRQLNRVVGSSFGRYIAVDVRMITEYDYPAFYQPPTANLQLSDAANLRQR